MSLAGKVAIVTGGARGIGRAYVEALAGAGAAVMIVDLLEDEGATMVAAIRAKGQQAAFLKVDVASRYVRRHRYPDQQCRDVRVAQGRPDERYLG